MVVPAFLGFLFFSFNEEIIILHKADLYIYNLEYFKRLDFEETEVTSSGQVRSGQISGAMVEALCDIFWRITNITFIPNLYYLHGEKSFKKK